MTPREELMVDAWEAARMRAALLTGDVDGAVPRLGRALLGGLLLAGVVVAALLLL